MRALFLTCTIQGLLGAAGLCLTALGPGCRAAYGGALLRAAGRGRAPALAGGFAFSKRAMKARLARLRPADPVEHRRRGRELGLGLSEQGGQGRAWTAAMTSSVCRTRSWRS